MMRRLLSLCVPNVLCGPATRFAAGFVALLLPVMGTAPIVLAQSTSGFTYNGIVYTSYQANEYLQTPQGPTGTAALRATGANYASVVVTQYVQTYTSNTIAPETASTPGYNPNTDPLTPTDAAVVAAIQNLQAQGLTVFLKPHVDSLDGTYRGDFAPTSPAAWFASYQTFILHYAQLASENGVGGLVIGTELASLSKSAYLSYWTNIITQIRSLYPDLTLAYGANATYASDEFTTVSFWSQVDIMGVDGYFPLTNQTNPTVAQLVAAWTDNKDGLNIVQALKNVQSTYNKPMIFTELGYVSAPGTNEAPFSSAAAGAAYDPTEQENCYEAFFEVFSQETAWMKGVFWWDWSVSPPGTNDTGYSPQNKPAGTVTLPKWYGSTTQGFTIAPSYSTLQVGQGLNAPDTISVTYQGGFNGAVTLTATGLPAGVTASFAPGTVAGTQVLTFSAASGATNGVTSVTVTGTSGAITASTTIALNVEAATAQTITFTNPGPQTVGTPLTLSATASSGLAVSFASTTTNVCTVSGTAASFLASGSCTITASQGGNSIYAAATPVSQTFAVSTVPAVPVPAADEVLVSQVNWLQSLGGNAITSNNPAGGSMGVTSNGEIVAGTGSGVKLFNSVTGAPTTLASWGGAGAVAVDSGNNIYISNYYSSAPIAKLPYVGGSTNAGYAAFTVPTGSTPACTSTSTTECTIAAPGSVTLAAMTFDAAGDLFYVTSYEGSGTNAIYECSVACLGGTGSAVMLFQEPAATTPPSATSGQLLIGAVSVDPEGNVFFTDSSEYVNAATYAYTSFSSSLKELPKLSGSAGYASLPTVLYSETPSSPGTYDNEIDAVVVSPVSGTVYFADQNNGVLAFPNNGTTVPTANGQPTALYTVSTQSAKLLTLDGQGNLYFEVYSSVLGSGGDTVGQITVDSVTVPSSPVGTAVSPSSTLNPVTTILNDGNCSATPAPSVSFVAGSSATATATVSASGTCASTVSGGATFSTSVSFTPSAGGNDSVNVTGTDQLSNTGTVTVNGFGVAPPTAQTITFNNPGRQSVGTPLTLIATATSGLPVTFTSASTTVCTVSATTATFLIAGTCTIDANQPGNSTYAAAPQVAQSFTVTAAPSYTLVATSGTLSVTQGSTATDTVTVTPANGFTGSVTLTATGLPTGVTASFGTNPATGASGITFTATNTATTGTSTVTITGTSGTLTASTTIALTVNAAPSFTLAPTSATVSVIQGASVTDTINVTGANGFTGSVTLTATGLPSGVTASFGTNPATGSSVLTLTASSTVTTGTATITISGTSGNLTASTTLALTVNLPPSFTLAPTAATVSVVQGASATDTINVTAANGFTGSVTLTATGLPSGVTASFGTNPATGSSVLTLTASSTAATGTATVTISGTSGTLTASTTVSVTVTPAPSFTLAPTAASVSVVQGATATDTVNVSGLNGFTGSVMLAATGLPTGVTASFGTNPATGPSVLTLTASSTAATGTTTVTITGTSGGLTASTTVSVTVTAAPSFTLAATAGTLSVIQGASATDTINVTGANGFSSGVTLSATGLPTGVTASFGTNPATASSVLTLTASSSAAIGTATVTITGTAGSLTESTTIALTVGAPPEITLSPAAATVTLNPGASGTDVITVGGANGFTGSVNLLASITASPTGAQDVPTLSFGATSPVTVASGAPGQATLSISTTAATSGALRIPSRGASPFALGGGATLACLLLFLLPSKRRRWPITLAMLALLCTVGAISGCGGGGGGNGGGGGGNTGTTAGNYTVTVTATSGTTSQTTTVTITVE
jgi:hypothetical protein